MIEIKIKVDNIDYGQLLMTALPVLLERMQSHPEANPALVKLLECARLLPPAAVQAMVDTLPAEKKEELAVGLLTAYQDQLAEALTEKAAQEHLSLKISRVEVRRTEA